VSLVSFLKKLNSSSIVIDVKSYSNTESAAFLGIENLSSNSILMSDIIIAINLEDTVSIRKSFKNFQKPIIWINTHGSKLASNAKYIVPSSTYFEQEGVFINLEQRPQKVLKTLGQVQDARSVKSILLSFYPNLVEKHRKYLDFLYEIVEQPNLFKSIKTRFSFFDIFENKYISAINTLSNYPLKNSFEDFYRSNNLSKNSTTMAKCSQEQRKTINNFKIND